MLIESDWIDSSRGLNSLFMNAGRQDENMGQFEIRIYVCCVCVHDIMCGKTKFPIGFMPKSMYKHVTTSQIDYFGNSEVQRKRTHNDTETEAKTTVAVA